MNMIFKNITLTNPLALKLKNKNQNKRFKSFKYKKGGIYDTSKEKRLFACLGELRK
jgi:hypothetical protein